MNPLAQANPFEGFVPVVTSDRTNVVALLVLTLATLVAVLLIVQIAAVMRARRKPRMLFYDLAQLHSVPRGTQQRLLNVCRVHRISDPAYLFLCPDLVQRIKSLEVSHARSDKERRRAEEFFSEFERTVIG
jgi:hypothetical protein